MENLDQGKKVEFANKTSLDEHLIKSIRAKVDVEKLLDSMQALLTPHEDAYNPETIYALARLVIELKDKLPHYKFILGDDTSGRLPTLFFKEVAKNIAKRDGIKTNIGTRFYAGGTDLGDNPELEGNIKEWLQKLIKPKLGDDGRILIVTEYMWSGESMVVFTKILAALEINFDIATISASKKIIRSLEKRSSILDVDYQSIKEIIPHIYCGAQGEVGFNVFEVVSSEFSGVTKELKKHPWPHALPVVKEERNPASMQKAREDIKKLADALSVLAY